MGILQFFLSTLWLTLLCSCLCLFDTIIELHAMVKKNLMTFSLESKNNLMSYKGLFNS